MLTELQKKKLTRYFRVYDIDDDGVIGSRDFERVLENLRILHGLSGQSLDFHALRAGFLQRWAGLCNAADQDSDGQVDLSEWLQYWDGVLADDIRYDSEVTTLAYRLIDLFDTDESGAIGANEFCDFFGAYGLSAALAREIFLDIDVNGDGQISRAELQAMAHEFYRSDDPDAPGNRLFGPLE